MNNDEIAGLLESYRYDHSAVGALVDLALSQEPLFRVAVEQIIVAIKSEIKRVGDRAIWLDVTPSSDSPANAYWGIFIRLNTDFCFALAFDGPNFMQPQAGIWYDHAKSSRAQVNRQSLNEALNRADHWYSRSTHDYWIAAGDAAQLFPGMSATDPGTNLYLLLSVDFARDFVKEARRAADAMRAALQELGSEQAGMPRISDQTSAGIG